MRRAFFVGLAVALVVGGAFVALGAGQAATGKKYKIVFDNAFGLTKGADFKVGGVAVGSITDLDVDRQGRPRARHGRGRPRAATASPACATSATCTINPQSLIGEYFVDCQPGKTGKLLEVGRDRSRSSGRRRRSRPTWCWTSCAARSPSASRSSSASSASASPPAAATSTRRSAARSRRSRRPTRSSSCSPRKRQTLADLARESGQVLKVLGRRRDDVDATSSSRPSDAAAATADRREAVAETFRRFPGFLDELDADDARPRHRLAPSSTPALADLRVAAPTVTALLNTLRPFSQASLPAVSSLGDASKSGRTASREARSLVGRLGAPRARPRPSRRRTCASILDHLDDRDFAVEKDPDSPGGARATPASRRRCSTSSTSRWRSTSSTSAATRCKHQPERRRVRRLHGRRGGQARTPRSTSSATRTSAPTSRASRPPTRAATRRAPAAATATRGAARPRPRRRRRRAPAAADRDARRHPRARRRGGEPGAEADLRPQAGPGPDRQHAAGRPGRHRPAHGRRQGQDSANDLLDFLLEPMRSKHDIRRLREPGARRRRDDPRRSSSPSSWPTTPTAGCRSSRPTSSRPTCPTARSWSRATRSARAATASARSPRSCRSSARTGRPAPSCC